MLRNAFAVLVVLILALTGYNFYLKAATVQRLTREVAVLSAEVKKQKEGCSNENADKQAASESFYIGSITSNQTPNSKPPQIEPQSPPIIEPVNFNGNRLSELIKASAIMENIRVLGRSCEWALKVKTNMTECKPFIEKLGPGGEWAQTSELISEIVSDKSHADDYLPELRRIERIMQDVVRHKEFVLSNLNVR